MLGGNMERYLALGTKNINCGQGRLMKTPAKPYGNQYDRFPKALLADVGRQADTGHNNWRRTKKTRL